jgi:hypothetical protein
MFVVTPLYSFWLFHEMGLQDTVFEVPSSVWKSKFEEETFWGFALKGIAQAWR